MFVTFKSSMKHFLLNFGITTKMKNLFICTCLCLTSFLKADVPDNIEEEMVYIPVIDGVYDLESHYSPFILETKRIEIENYPIVFNPSIVSWKGKWLLSFRIREGHQTHKIGLVWVDEELHVLSPPFELQTSHELEQKIQDPRLYVLNDKLYMIYSALVQIDKKDQRRVFIGEIVENKDTFSLVNTHPFLSFEKESHRRIEKNWTPFDHQDELLLSYTFSPHRVFRPIPEENRCERFSLSEEEIRWEFGEIRGGTPAIHEEGYYLTFFHSSKKIASYQSDKKMMMHYFMGAILFEDKPPFAIKAISPAPILGENFYTKTDFKTWKPLKVVFPCGLMSIRDQLWVVYGKQDSEIWATKISKPLLFNSLISIEH